MGKVGALYFGTQWLDFHKPCLSSYNSAPLSLSGMVEERGANTELGKTCENPRQANNLCPLSNWHPLNICSTHLEEVLDAAEGKEAKECYLRISSPCNSALPPACILQSSAASTVTQVCAWRLLPHSSLSFYRGLCSLKTVSIDHRDCVEDSSHFGRLAPPSQLQR